MRLHRNAKLGLAGRFALVRAREQGLSMREVARRFRASPATVCRWDWRWRQASEEERCTLACLLDRSSRPEHLPRLLPASAQRPRFTRPGHAVTGDRSTSALEMRARVGYEYGRSLESALAIADPLATPGGDAKSALQSPAAGATWKLNIIPLSWCSAM